MMKAYSTDYMNSFIQHHTMFTFLHLFIVNTILDRRKVTVCEVMCGDNHMMRPILIEGNLNSQRYLDI